MTTKEKTVGAYTYKIFDDEMYAFVYMKGKRGTLICLETREDILLDEKFGHHQLCLWGGVETKTAIGSEVVMKEYGIRRDVRCPNTISALFESMIIEFIKIQDPTRGG